MLVLITTLVTLILSALTAAQPRDPPPPGATACGPGVDLRCNGANEIQICQNFTGGWWWVFTYRCPYGYRCFDNQQGGGSPHCVMIMAPCHPICSDEEKAAFIDAEYARLAIPDGTTVDADEARKITSTFVA